MIELSLTTQFGQGYIKMCLPGPAFVTLTSQFISKPTFYGDHGSIYLYAHQ